MSPISVPMDVTSPNPCLGGLAKHHPANAGDSQDNGQHVDLAEALRQLADVLIPIQSGRGFRFAPGHHCDLKPAT